ncbi:ML domain-containing protein [Mycena rebaudengoi]|nr:ML domain-containing protein [Mycena rebaudengoi]
MRLTITLISLFALLLQVCADSSGWEYDNCGRPDSPVQIESIQVSPDPPVPGKDLTVTVKAVVTEVIEEGAYADVTVKLGRIKLLQKTFDLCEEGRKANADVSCPVEEGPLTVVQTVALPKEIPKAKFVVLVRGFTVDQEDMLCLDLKIDFMKSITSLFTSQFS